jgi:ATP-dependent DNA helicase RecG
MHRDLQSNTPLRFYEFASHLEILNAGGLYGNARPENFPSVNDYRNPLVASAMKTLGYVNMFNRGVGQVQTDLKENGNQPAEFNVNLITAFKVDVKVSQSYTNENGSKTGGKVVGDIVENVVGKDLNDVEKPSDVVENVVENKGNVVENILASISKNSNISTKELAAMCSLSERQVQRIMAKLKKQGVIRRIGPDKGGHWEIIAP